MKDLLHPLCKGTKKAFLSLIRADENGRPKGARKLKEEIRKLEKKAGKLEKAGKPEKEAGKPGEGAGKLEEDAGKLGEDAGRLEKEREAELQHQRAQEDYKTEMVTRPLVLSRPYGGTAGAESHASFVLMESAYRRGSLDFGPEEESYSALKGYILDATSEPENGFSLGEIMPKKKAVGSLSCLCCPPTEGCPDGRLVAMRATGHFRAGVKWNKEQKAWCSNHSTTPTFDLAEHETFQELVYYARYPCLMTCASDPALFPKRARLRKPDPAMEKRATPSATIGKRSVGEMTAASIGFFEKLPNEIILMIVEYLDARSQLALGLTNTVFLLFIEDGLWLDIHANRSPITSNDGKSRVGFLALLERDYREKGMFVCCQCRTMHNSSAFPPEEILKDPSDRKCYRRFGKISLAYFICLSWPEMRAFPNNSRKTSFATYCMCNDGPAAGGFVHVAVEMGKVDSIFFSTTRYEIPAATNSALEGDARTVLRYVGSIPGWLCPHIRLLPWWPEWGTCHPLLAINGCTDCKTDVWMDCEDLDGRKCLVLQTWRIFGRDADPANEEWGSQCQHDFFSGRLSLARKGRAHYHQGGNVRESVMSMQAKLDMAS
jgi:hypothetical protein